jgi:prevent-host-death family protein
VTEVNIHEAKTHLSRLVERVQQGEEVIIAKAGRPIAKLVKIEPTSKRVLGSATGTIKFTPGWEAPLTDEEMEEFLGE